MGKELLLNNLRQYFEKAYKTIEKDKDLDFREKLEMQEVVKNFSLLANDYEECIKNMHMEELKQINGEER